MSHIKINDIHLPRAATAIDVAAMRFANPNPLKSTLAYWHDWTTSDAR